MAPHHGRAETARLGSQPQARVPDHVREDNLLLPVCRRKFVVTTDSNHSRPVYPNLARSGMMLTGLDQLWGADITYIRLEWEFVYLAVVLDAYSRRVDCWRADRTLEEELTLAACGWLSIVVFLALAGTSFHRVSSTPPTITPIRWKTTRSPSA